MSEAAARELGGSPPLRVSTLELFFDLVFAFTLTRLTALLDRNLSPREPILPTRW